MLIFGFSDFQFLHSGVVNLLANCLLYAALVESSVVRIGVSGVRIWMLVGS